MPRVYEMYAGRFRLVVHRYHGLDGWFFTCNPLFDKCELKAHTYDDAFEEALGLIRPLLATAVKALG